MDDAKQRVVDELKELSVKFSKLVAFMCSDRFFTLEDEMQWSMREQRTTMMNYMDCLAKRLSIWDKPINKCKCTCNEPIHVSER